MAIHGLKKKKVQSALPLIELYDAVEEWPTESTKEYGTRTVSVYLDRNFYFCIKCTWTLAKSIDL